MRPFPRGSPRGWRRATSSGWSRSARSSRGSWPSRSPTSSTARAWPRRRGLAEGAVAGGPRLQKRRASDLRRARSAATTHRVWGLPVLAAVLYLCYLFVGVFGAKTLVDLLENGLFGKILSPAATARGQPLHSLGDRRATSSSARTASSRWRWPTRSRSSCRSSARSSSRSGRSRTRATCRAWRSWSTASSRRWG